MDSGSIGYTEDGMVFMSVHTVLDGKSVQTLMQWEPGTARRIAKTIDEAATKAQEMITPIGLEQ